MMRILLAPASFKGSLSAFEASEAMALGVREAHPDAAIDLCPIGDGGEGTAEILARSCPRYEEWWTHTVDALGRPIDARWFLIHDAGAYSSLFVRGTAVLDAASCLGITLVPKDELDPMAASSRGLGIMVRAIADEGASRIVIGLGGTATMDAGIGFAGALGWTFHDKAGSALAPTPSNLGRIASATPPQQPFDAEVIALCDVRAPLAGPTGAARVFGPQKGATPDQAAHLDAGMASFARAIGRGDPNEPGAGAAGGLGWALRACAGGALLPGASAVLDAVGFDDRAKAADLVITGEGRLDAQTGMGKAVSELAARARRIGKPAIAIVGQGDGDRAAIASRLGLREIISLSAGPEEDARAMVEARARVRDAAARAATTA